MAKQGAVCWVLLTTVFCGVVSAAVPPAPPSLGDAMPDRSEQVTMPQETEPPLMLARRDRRERRRDRRDRRQEWRHEARKDWRRERRSDAVAAGVGGLIIGGALGAAAASSQRRTYEQNIYNYPSYGSDYPYPR